MTAKSWSLYSERLSRKRLMCTSFVLYGDKTYIGMNFDISDRPIVLSLKGGDQFIASQKEADAFYPAFGLNRCGTFVNLLIVEPNEAGRYRRGNNYIHLARLFDDLLGGLIAPEALEALLREKQVVNVPSHSLHSLVTGPDGYACVIEPGCTTTYLRALRRNFLALTNFPLAPVADKDYTLAEGTGADRYKTCYRMLEESEHAFNVEQGFAILEATAQYAGDWPTQFSMLAVPQDDAIHFVLNRRFHRRFSFSFADHLIRTECGFTQLHTRKLDKTGIRLSTLEAW